MKKLLFIASLSVIATSAFAQGACCSASAQTTSAPVCSSKQPFDQKDAEFLKLAAQMSSDADEKKPCCKSTEQKVVMKGDKGCCNNVAEVARFKVFVAGQGYKFFGCEDSAKQGRSTLVAKGSKVGKIQRVSTKRTIG